VPAFAKATADKPAAFSDLSFDRLRIGQDTPFGSFPLASGCPIEESRDGQDNENF